MIRNHLLLLTIALFALGAPLAACSAPPSPESEASQLDSREGEPLNVEEKVDSYPSYEPYPESPEEARRRKAEEARRDTATIICDAPGHEPWMCAHCGIPCGAYP